MSDDCPNRCPTPNGIGTICRKTFDLLPAGPCPKNCEHRPARTA
jgi:hypothetical protein